MLDPQTVLASTSVVVAVGLPYVIRESIKGNIRRATLADLARLRETFDLKNYSLPTPEDPGIAASKRLHQALGSSRELRMAAQQDVLSIKIPDLGTLDSMPAAMTSIADVEQKYGQLYQSTLIGKARSLVKDSAMHHLKDKAHGKLAEKGAGAIKNALKHGPGEQVIVDGLEAVGIIAVGNSVADVAADIVPVDVLDAAVGLLDAGVFSAARASWSEIKMLCNQETSFSETLEYAAVPIVIKSGAIAIGAAMDTACGWATLGLFTLLGSIAGSVANKAWIKPEIEADQASLRRLASERDARYKAMATNVTVSAKQKISDYVGAVEKYVPLEDAPTVTAAIESIDRAARADEVNAQQKIDETLQARTDAIRPTWIQRLFLINEKKVVAPLHQSWASSVKEHIAEIAGRFKSNNYSNSATRAIGITEQLPTTPYLVGGEMQSVVKDLPNIVDAAIETHVEQVARWASECEEVKVTALKDIAEQNSLESASFKRYQDGIKPEIADLGRRLKSNFARIGVSV